MSGFSPSGSKPRADGVPQTADSFEPLDLSPRRRAWVTFGIMMGLFLGALEATVVTTAMPTVISSLGGLKIYAWVYSVYFLSSTVTIPLWGRFSDLYGRKRFYLAGIACFVAASALCGMSRSMAQLIAFRTIQGIGAGALVPLGMTIAGEIYTLERRARIQGLFSGVWGISSIVGPLVGGLITDFISWRAVFFLNVPFGVAAALIIAVALREPPLRRRSVDLGGALLLIALLVLFLIGLDLFKSPQTRPAALLLVAASGLLTLLFLRVERRAPDPILPLTLFSDSMFRAAALNGLFCGMALFGAITFIPLFFQGVVGTGATGAGWFLTPLLLAWVITSIVAGRVFLRIGYRRTVFAGVVGLTVGFFLLSRMTSETPASQVTLLMILIGGGMGLCFISLLLAVQNRFPREELGAATSSTQFFRNIGAAIGIAAMGAVLASQMLAGLEALGRTGDDPLAHWAARPDAIVNPLARRGIPPSVLVPLQALLGKALHRVFQSGFLMALAALASAFLVPGGSARKHARRL